MRIALYPGTFDPITNGHSDIILRATEYLCDKLILSVADNARKTPLFTMDERVEMCQSVIDGFPKTLTDKITIQPFKGLLMQHAKEMNAHIIVRGLRAVSDFEYEFQMAGMNARISENIETVFLMASESNQFISSRFIKEINQLGGDVKSFVDPLILEQLNAKQHK